MGALDTVGPNEFFLNMIRTKVVTLVNEGKRVAGIEHSLLKGRYREFGLQKLLRYVIPQGFELGTGVLHDVNGTQSSETDLIIWNRRLLPPILFSEVDGVFPVESCVYCFEVKSRLTRQTLSDAIKKFELLSTLKCLGGPRDHVLNECRPITVLFAYDSDLDGDREELDRYIELDPHQGRAPIIQTICIVGKGYFHFQRARKGVARPDNWIWLKPDDEYYEVVGLMGEIANTLRPSDGPYFGHYILYSEKREDYVEVIPWT